MTDDVLTPERILCVAEDVLRRYGPSKATVVDVARVLGVSHGSVYRHFPSKAALRDAVTERWLARMSEPLHAVVAEHGSATERLERWFRLLYATKRSYAADDPELFATYVELATEAREVVNAHVDELVAMVTAIITDGMAQGEFTVDDPVVVGRAVFNAMTCFHNPAYAAEWSNPETDSAFEGVLLLIFRALHASVNE